MVPKKFKVVIPVVLFIAGLGLGFLAGKSSNPPTYNPSLVRENPANSLYSSQTAFIRGKITHIEGKILSVINLNNATSGNIIASDRLIVTKPKQASPSSDLSQLETDKEALISLELKDDRYEAVSIQYVNPPPNLPPLTTQKLAKPSPTSKP